jgi:uncharacterized protein YecA (UPF0149 family)
MSPVSADSPQTPQNRQFVSPPSNASQPSNEEPCRYRLVQQLMDETEEVEPEEFEEYSGLCLLGMEDPNNFEEANSDSA